MPAPPVEIRIKRKATDDPVDLLHIQNEYNGLRQIKQYVFKRQRTSVTTNNNPSNPSIPPSLHTPQPAISFTGSQIVLDLKASHLPEAPVSSGQGFTKPLISSEETVPTGSTDTSTDQSRGHGIDQQPSTTFKSEPRRFHLSRSSIGDTAGEIAGHIRGAKGAPAVFIEQRRVSKLDSKASNASIPREPNLASQNASTDQYENSKETAQLPSTATDALPRPPAPLRNIRLPSGKIVPWDADSATLAAEMQAYTMQEIGYNLVRASRTEVSMVSVPIIRARQVSSFKPKAPALKYHERYPDQARAVDGKMELKQDEIMTDAVNADGDESGYVMDTYIRMPAEMFEYQEQKNIGLLVLDSQPDIDEFYNDDSDSDSDIYDDDEDENAENHPSTDYPEDEVDSDDEYGRNTYHCYRNRNASDNEEYDEDEVTYSDDEAKPPWARRSLPWRYQW